jgi:uncharacterized membrane protein YeiH
LALFCITGTFKALSAGMNPVAAMLLGVTTAVGGGLLRDITANEVPSLFNPTGHLRAAGLRGRRSDHHAVASWAVQRDYGSVIAALVSRSG